MGLWTLGSTNREAAWPCWTEYSWSLHSPAWSQMGQSSGWLISSDSSTASRICFVAGDAAWISIPGEMGVAQAMAPRGVCGS